MVVLIRELQFVRNPDKAQLDHFSAGRAQAAPHTIFWGCTAWLVPLIRKCCLECLCVSILRADTPATPRAPGGMLQSKEKANLPEDRLERVSFPPSMV